MEGNCWLVVSFLCPLRVTLYVMSVRNQQRRAEALGGSRAPSDSSVRHNFCRGFCVSSLPCSYFPVSGRVFFSLPLHRVLYSLPHPASLTEQSPYPQHVFRLGGGSKLGDGKQQNRVMVGLIFIPCQRFRSLSP